MMLPTILAISGSTRAGSYNTALARMGAESLREAGAQVRLLNLAEFELPIYSGDIERDAGLPDRAIELRRIFKEADGFFVASPEHNMSVSALLKNAIDWISRAYDGESGKVPFEGKSAALCAASTGSLGGHRGLMHLRLILSGLGVVVLPAVVGVGNASQAFDGNGHLKDVTLSKSLRALAQTLVVTTSQLRASRPGESS